MPKFLFKIFLIGFFCAMPFRPVAAESLPTHSVHSAHAESTDDQAYRIRQRQRLAIIMSVLLVVAAVYVIRQRKNSPPAWKV
jgi:hypothetical protein